MMNPMISLSFFLDALLQSAQYMHVCEGKGHWDPSTAQRLAELRRQRLEFREIEWPECGGQSIGEEGTMWRRFSLNLSHNTNLGMCETV